MKKARKAVGDKVILDDVTMIFYPGAKIGVVGPNGAGKSTILKIMAGLDTPSNGEAFLTPGCSVGILQQEPPLDEDKTVLENIQEGFGEINAKLARYNEVAEQMATDYTDELMEEMGKLQEELDHADAWDLDAQLDQAMDALRCPPAGRRRSPSSPVASGAGSRCASCCCAPDLLLLDEPTNHLDAESVQWLEQYLASLPRRRPGRHPRPVLPGQRRAVDRRGRPRPAYPVRGQLLHLPGEEGRADGGRGPQGRQARQAAQGRAGLGPVRREGPAGQVQVPAGPVRGDGRRGRDRTRKLDFEEIQIPPGPRLGSVVVEVANLKKGFDDRVLIDDLSFTLPRNGIVGVIGPNGVGKTTLFKTIVGLEEPDSGIVKVGETVKLSYVDQNRGGHRPEEERLAGGLRRARLHQGRPRRDAVPGLRLGVRVQGSRPAEAGRGAVRRGAQPAQPGADPQGGRQPDPARRADQRPRRRDARLAGERARAVPRAAPW